MNQNKLLQYGELDIAMRKYNILILSSLIIYLVISIFSFYFLGNVQEENELGYQVEINRIMDTLKNKKTIDSWNREEYTWIKEVTFLKESAPKEEVEHFYQKGNDQLISIVPWYQDGKLLGYLKFSYENQNQHIYTILWTLELSLFLLELFIIFVLCYIKYRIIVPFHRVSTLPYELAKGKYIGEVKVEKGKYFKNFLWGMSTLKDTLDSSRMRELEFMKERKQLLLSLSHDMKTPIHIIKLYVTSLEENVYPEESKRQAAIHQIGEKALEMEKYVEEITKSTREEVFDLPVTIEPFYLRVLLSRLLPIYEERCSIRNIEFVVSTYQDCLIKGDINRSQEVLENILENAIKYGDGKNIEITFSEEENHNLIHIKNTGLPVSENEMNHLFDSFFRGKNAKGKKGSGLGLYICRELMKKMGGTIYAYREDDSMTFVVVLKKDVE